MVNITFTIDKIFLAKPFSTWYFCVCLYDIKQNSSDCVISFLAHNIRKKCLSQTKENVTIFVVWYAWDQLISFEVPFNCFSFTLLLFLVLRSNPVSISRLSYIMVSFCLWWLPSNKSVTWTLKWCGCSIIKNKPVDVKILHNNFLSWCFYLLPVKCIAEGAEQFVDINCKLKYSKKIKSNPCSVHSFHKLASL